MVLHKAYMPRVLIENGFISNPIEGKKLDSEEGQQENAEAIAKAIISYKKEFFDGEASDAQAEKPSQRVEEKPIKKIEETKKDTIAKKSTPKSVENGVKGLVYKIQISASTTKLELVPSNFKGLKNVSATHTSIYKYMYGETSSYDEAKKLLREAKSKGFDSAYIIAFKDGKSVDSKDITK